MSSSMSDLKRVLAASGEHDDTLKVVTDPSFDPHAGRMNPLLGNTLFNDIDLDDIDIEDMDSAPDFLKKPTQRAGVGSFMDESAATPPPRASATIPTPSTQPTAPRLTMTPPDSLIYNDDDIDLDGEPISRAEAISGEINESSQLSVRTSIITILSVVVVIIVVAVIVFFAIGKNASKKAANKDPETQTTGTQTQGSDTVESLTSTAVRTNNQTFKFSEKLYQDSLQISKCIVLDKNVVHCYFTGKLADYKEPVMFEVSADDYNRLAEGDIVTVNFNVSNFGDKQYLTNIQVMEG